MESQTITGIPVTKVSGEAPTAPSRLLRLFPSITDFAFLLPFLALLTALPYAKTLLRDADTGWHIRTGDWILQHRQVPYKDLFSFTMPDGNWFAWEWGWDVLFSLIHSRWGLSGVLLANAIILGVVSALLYRLVRRRAGNDVLAFLISAMAICASSLHWLARPHLLSWVFILAFLHLIDRAEEGQTNLLWWTPLLTVVWVNLHGSFFVGIVFLLTYGVVKRQRTYFLTSLACLAASLVNPYGWHLHEHVVRYLLDAKQLQHVSEYASLDFHSMWAVGIECFLILGVAAAWRSLSLKRWAEAVMILIWAHLALQASRNIPIFLFIAAPPSAAFLCYVFRKWASYGQHFRAFERVERVPLVAVVAIGLFAAAQPSIQDFDREIFPVAAASVIARHPDARVFTFDQWGDYLIYRFFPQRRVFVDARSDFYGADFSQKWLEAIKARYDWDAELSRYRIDTVLLETDQPLASVLKQSRDWRPVFDDGLAIIFRRRNLSEWNAR